MEIDSRDWAAILQWSQFQAGFLARTSHELRSPLSSLMSLHQLILNDLCDDREEERDCIRQAYEAANRLLKMLEIATQISKLSIGSVTPQQEPISLQVLLDEVRVLTTLQAANRNIQLQVENLPPDWQHTTWIESDHSLLRQVLVCLLESTLSCLSSGVITLSCQLDLEHNRVNFNLETDPPMTVWQEAKDLLLPQGLNPSLMEKSITEKITSENTVGTNIAEKNIVEKNTVEKNTVEKNTVEKNTVEKRIIDKFPPYLSSLTQSHGNYSPFYNLMISQLLLDHIAAKLTLIESEQFPETFYLQCQLNSPIEWRDQEFKSKVLGG